MRRIGVAIAVLAIAGSAGCEREIESVDDAPATGPGATGATSSTTGSDRAPETAAPASPSPTTEPATSTSTSRPDSIVATSPPIEPAATATSCTGGMSLRELAALLTWPAVVTDDWEAARAVVGELGVGGVLLMAPGDGVSRDELADLLGELDGLSRHGVLVATDEEGGAVQRLRRYRPLPSQREIAATMTPDAAAALIAEHGAFVREIGIDVILGPVVDVAPAAGRPALATSRFFATSPDDVAAYATAYVEGWTASGLLPTLKHFPGHGGASADTHDALGVTAPVDELETRDLVPYRTLAAAIDRGDGHEGVPIAVMVGHLDVPGLTDGAPASLSPAAVDHLRSDVGLGDALVISDALEMGAIDVPVPEAAVASIAAGVDAVLFADTSAAGSVVDAIVAAVESGELSEERVVRAADRVMRSHPGRDCGRGDR